ncbi:hypothetical protein N7510_004072 [Penicillium lagena]|uniref:uncharacterized protein n=1 Tax=Penicillium lagena TaxID=94218 RepID=UPI0025421EAB|nr:uncharacterized protein N7510_004072 [Penicillium lagena]KAJ5620088.1 hypothetical protein N7510_004072 [Penicillium lagena]
MTPGYFSYHTLPWCHRRGHAGAHLAVDHAVVDPPRSLAPQTIETALVQHIPAHPFTKGTPEGLGFLVVVKVLSFSP